MSPGIPILLAMRDVKAAFKLVAYSLSDCSWFGTRLPCKLMAASVAFAAGWTCLLVVFGVMQFGWTESPGNYCVHGAAISQAHRALGPPNFLDWSDLAFFSLTYVDDGVVAEPDLGCRASGSCSAYDWALETVLGSALNLKKLATTGVLAAIKTVWGLSFDLSGIVDGPQFAFVTLTSSKFIKMATWAALPSTQPGVRRVLVKDHQKLVGNVQWWSTCSPALRSLLPSLYSASAFAEGQYLDLPSEAAWLEYDDAKALLLFFIDMGESRPDLFRASLVDALDFYDVARLPVGLDIKVRYIGSDANGLETGGVMSAVDYLAGTWAVARADEYSEDLMRLCAESSEATVDTELIILVTELLAVIALAAQHCSSWSGYLVAAMIDNEGARIALSTRRSRNRYVRYLLLVLGRLEFEYKFRVVAYYANTKTNWFLDYIGRDLDLDAPGALETLQRELIDQHCPGFVYEPLDTLLRFFTSGGSVLRSFEVPGELFPEQVERHLLADALPEPKPPLLSRDEISELLAGCHFGEICAGTGVLGRTFASHGLPLGGWMESDDAKQRFLHHMHQSTEVLWCSGVLGSDYSSWSLHHTFRAIGGGPPCVFASQSGRQRGLADPRSDPMTVGVGKVARALGGSTEVWCLDVENVDQVALLHGGAALRALDDDLIGEWARTPRLVDSHLGVELVDAAEHGSCALRLRLALHYEANWMVRLLGECPPLTTPSCARGRLADILEPSSAIPDYLCVPGRFFPLTSARPDSLGIVVAGYHEYGLASDPFVRGSLVSLPDVAGSWRVMVIYDGVADLLFTDRHSPVYRKRVNLVGVGASHVRERRRVLHRNSIATTINRFGEPFEGPAHFLLHDPERGVRIPSSRELWRLQGGLAADQYFEAFKLVNPVASYEVLAGAAGDAIAQVYATAVAERTTLRLALATRALKRVIRVQALVRARSIRAGVALPDPTLLSSRGGLSGLGLTYNRWRADGRRARGPGFAAALIQRAWRCLQARLHLLLHLHAAGGDEAVALNLICYDTLGPEVAHGWMAPSFRPASGTRAETTRAGGPRKRVVRGSCATANIASARSRLLDSATSEGTKRTYGSAFGPWALWRVTRRQRLFLSPDDSVTDWEDELCDFYAHGGSTLGFSWHYMHTRLYAVRYAHHARRVTLDIRQNAMPFLCLLTKGLKRRCGADNRKVPVTIEQMLEIHDHDLDMSSYNGMITFLAVLVAFFFLLRCSEYLRKGRVIDSQKCVRQKDVKCLVKGQKVNCPVGVKSSEFALHHNFDKVDFLGQGSDDNIGTCDYDSRLCIPSLVDRLRVKNPHWLVESRQDDYLFQLDDGNLIEKTVITRLLRTAALRSGLDPSVMDTHSLRAGGCTAMADAGFPEHEIQRRGRWASACWKIYCWGTRALGSDVANRMAQASSDLFAHLRSKMPSEPPVV